VLVHIFARDPVRNALEAERRDQPIEDRGRRAGDDGLIQTSALDFGVDLVEKGCRPRYRTDRPN
jgi:hypothetical protein